MSRRATGKTTIYSIPGIDISYLKGNGAIVPEKTITGTIGWVNNVSIGFESNLENDSYIRLAYACDGIEKDYKIVLASIPSNLGKGEIFYFVCPVNASRCRRLYWCEESGIWQSRTAFKERLYYPYQLSSKFNYSNDRYWAIERQLEELYSKAVKPHSLSNKKTRLVRAGFFKVH